MKPGKLQNALEALMDFTKGIVNSAVERKQHKRIILYIFSLFFFCTSRQYGWANYLYSL